MIRFTLWVIGLGLLGTVALVFWIDHTVQQKFGTQLWDIPVHIYGSPFEIYPGQIISSDPLNQRLLGLGYRRVNKVTGAGEFVSSKDSIELVTRPFEFWDGPQPSRAVRVDFAGGKIRSIYGKASGQPVPLLRLKPQLIDSLSQSRHEDRYLVRLDDMPRLLLETLVAVEDRRFTKHRGIDLWAILRAAWANIRAGGIVQGGSTLTQQLIKNVYGRDDPTYRRKLLEAATALVLEYRLDKRQILEAYCNEVFLGQAGKRAIHGFGLGSQYFFGRPVSELNPNEIAQLVGMIKAPSSYNPWRRPEQAKQRRKTVLKVMNQQKLIDDAVYDLYADSDLQLHSERKRSRKEFSSFIDVVFRQLSDRLDAGDMTRGALSVFTTMDIEVQRAAENALSDELTRIEKRANLPKDSLEGAIVVLRPDTGEILAIVGSRNPSFGTFNRATSARRQVGSLIKPVVYLTAFMNNKRWTHATVVSDTPVTYEVKGSRNWSPNNFDNEFLGKITLLDALAQSRNVPAAKVGMQVGLQHVAENLRRLGVDVGSEVYPSILLGAVEMSPVEVARMYQVLANSGYQADLRTISAITADARAIGRTKSSKFRPVLPADKTFLTLFGLQEVVRSGTGKGLLNTFSPKLNLAGKTGTTDDHRDSWFVGLAGNLLTIVWVGRDNNTPTGLTGASGAMRVWANMMKRVNLQPLELHRVANVQYVNIDLDSGLKATARCERIRQVPFLDGTAPTRNASCL